MGARWILRIMDRGLRGSTTTGYGHLTSDTTMPTPSAASSVSGAPTQYDIVRMAAYAAAQKETYDALIAELTQFALHSPVTERAGSHEIADYLWVIIGEWQQKRPR